MHVLFQKCYKNVPNKDYHDKEEHKIICLIV